MQDFDNQPTNDFVGLKISLASPEKILGWSHGEVTKPETINYRTFRTEKDGLFDERIFGPTKDYECYCGKYKGRRYKGIICDRCGVEVTTSAVRRERMGHVKLATPIAHIWYFKGANSPISLLLEIPTQALDRIIYYALYLTTKVNDEKRKGAIEILEKMKLESLTEVEQQYKQSSGDIDKKIKSDQDKLKRRIKNKEQLDLALQELEFKKREQLKVIAEKYANKKLEKTNFFDRITKIAKALKPLMIMEESDFLFLRENGLDNFFNVGMGAEVIYESLANLDLQKLFSEVSKKVNSAKGDKRRKLLKRIRIVEAFIKAKIEPKWMVFTILPILPPDLRPVVQLPGGKFATSDLNDFYRRVINRNNRLKELIDLGAPEIILRNEKRMLQEAVDSLIDLQKTRTRKIRGARSSKVQKSLSDILKGKQGRFRQNLLGKRVDYSGRSTIIVGPELKIDQCGIPKEMALELFKPFLLHKIIIKGLAPNLKSAKNFLEQKEPVVYDLLEEVIKGHPILLNRAPTLHKLSILGFYPVLTDGYAIKLHPTVCSGFNADFDGDAMGAFLPLSKMAIKEIKERMLPYNNLLKPADGSPIILPNKEMALGCYYLTTLNARYKSKKNEELKFYVNEDEVLKAFYLGQIKLRQPILTRIKDKLIKTSAGRIIFNQTLPEQLKYLNKPIKASDIKDLVTKSIKIIEDKKEIGAIIDRIKNVGFWGATMAGGLSISILDLVTIKNRSAMIKKTEEKARQIEKNYQEGIVTLEEKRRLSNRLWIDTTEKMTDLTWNIIDEENPVKIIIKSGGARASREQLKQLAAMKGLVIDPLGKIIDIPTKSNYREGLSVLEYIISARGARKGLTDSALKTANAGYLTRRLVDVAHDMIVREDDCGTNEGLTITKKGVRGEMFNKRIYGRYLLKPIYKDKKILIDKGRLIDEAELKLIEKNKIKKVTIRSPLYCKSTTGVCRKCYGLDLSNKKVADIGTPVGILAAQSIGEPGTQLTMRVRHFGGIVISDVTQGLPRVEQLFETRTPKVVSPITRIAGKVEIKEDRQKEVYNIKIISSDKKNSQEQEVIIPLSQKLKVTNGQLVGVGVSLSEGYLDIDEILTIKGLNEAQLYLLNEIQSVYESQGIQIHDKHFEVIIKKMSDKVIIEDEGNSSFIKDEIVSKSIFEEENKKIITQGGKPAAGKVSILGITQAAIHTESWLSAASFQQTTKVLSQAAIKGKIDYLLGLKENVIIGRLIPVNEELNKKYYSQFLNYYADNQSIGQEGTKAEDKKIKSGRSENQL